MDFLKWAKSNTLPSALQSREGWAALFEYHRTATPHIHQIEPTNHCPYSCLMCPRKRLMIRQKGYMDLTVFQKIIDEIVTYPAETREKEIELFHFGESLLHPQLPEMISYISDRQLKATLSINPGELTAPLIDRLLQASPFQIIVSIDSMDPVTYRKLRGPYADLAAAVANTKLLLTKHHAACSRTSVTIRMIVMHENRSESEHFTKYWQERRANVELRDFFPWNDKEIATLGPTEHYPPHMPCPFPWQYLVVQWNGDVVACCRDYNGRLVLGNVMENSLQDIWNGENARRLREGIATGKGLDRLCEECLQLYCNGA